MSLAGLFIGIGMWAAQPALALTSEETLAAQQSIESRRQAAESKFAREQQACGQIFAVNNCLNAARKRRDEVLAELKREQLILNDEARRKNAAAKLDKLEERASPQLAAQALEQRTKRMQAAQNTQQSQAEKEAVRQQQRETGVTKEKENRHANDLQEKKKAVSDRTQAIKSRDTNLSVDQFERKQREAAEHQKTVEKTRSERTKPLSAALPPTGSAIRPLVQQLSNPRPD